MQLVITAEGKICESEGEQVTKLKRKERIWCETMRNPDLVLESLERHSNDKIYKYEKLYRNLYNTDFFLKAYAKIYANEGNMTEGTDYKTIDGFSIQRVEKLIEKLKDESYQPNPLRRTYILKKDGKQRRLLGTSSFDDKLVQEVIRSILEAIYEGSFSDNSHGFRRDRSCHTALLQIKHNFTGVKWWIEGDIKGFFDNLDHETLIALLRKRIKDDKFIRLIWKFLKAGYLEDFMFNKTYSGIPQGGILSPILANIYVHELDNFMEGFMEKFNKGNKRKTNKTYKVLGDKIGTKRKILEKVSAEEKEITEAKIEALRSELRDLVEVPLDQKTPDYERVTKNLRNKIYKLNRKLREPAAEERKGLIKEIKEFKKTQKTLPSYEQIDPDYRRMKYVRYADDFLIGIIGTKEEAEKIRNDLTQFLKEQLRLELSEEKTLITHWHDKVRFLGYDIFINEDDIIQRRQFGDRVELARTGVGSVKLSMPFDVLESFMVKKSYMKIINGKWKAMHNPKLLNCDDLEILHAYNAEYRGLYQYYKFAFNVKEKLGNAHFIFSWSFKKTLAGKYKTKVSKLLKMKTESGQKKYFRDGVWGVTYMNKREQENFVPLFEREEIVFAKKIFKIEKDVDRMPNTVLWSKSSLIQRLQANKCEWCGDTKGPFEVHHVKKLKDLKGKKKWEKHMIARQRKTLVLCGVGSERNCHRRLHNGELD